LGDGACGTAFCGSADYCLFVSVQPLKAHPVGEQNCSQHNGLTRMDTMAIVGKFHCDCASHGLLLYPAEK